MMTMMRDMMKEMKEMKKALDGGLTGIRSEVTGAKKNAESAASKSSAANESIRALPGSTGGYFVLSLRSF